MVLTLICGDGEPPADLSDTLRRWGITESDFRTLSAPEAKPLAMEVALKFQVSTPPTAADLRSLAQRWRADLTLMPRSQRHSRRRLVAFDMDSTLIQCEVIDELAARAGVGDAVAAVTARAMRGELDFKASFRERMAKLRGLDEGALEIVARELPIMPGAERLLARLRDLGHYTVILSGGFDYFASRLQQHLGFHEIHANQLQIADGALTGEVNGPIVDGALKEALLRRIAAEQGIAMEDTVAVGDGANDLPMLGASGLGVAFHAKPLVQERAPHVVTYNDLDALLYVLGIKD